MKTIEDRAKECIPDAFDERYSAGFYQGYIVGATDQQKIDHDKTCERTECPYRTILERYRQAMEEDI